MAVSFKACTLSHTCITHIHKLTQKQHARTHIKGAGAKMDTAGGDSIQMLAKYTKN